MEHYYRIERQAGGAVIGHNVRLAAAKGGVLSFQHSGDPPAVLLLVRPEVADGPQMVVQAVEVVALVQSDIQPPAAAEYQRVVRMPAVFAGAGLALQLAGVLSKQLLQFPFQRTGDLSVSHVVSPSI